MGYDREDSDQIRTSGSRDMHEGKISRPPSITTTMEDLVTAIDELEKVVLDHRNTLEPVMLSDEEEKGNGEIASSWGGASPVSVGIVNATRRINVLKHLIMTTSNRVHL